MKYAKNGILAGVFVFALAVATIVAVPTAHAGVFSDSDSDLGDIFILDELFDGNGFNVLNDGTGRDLGDLFILEKIFDNDGSDVFGNGDSLGDLFILDELFGDGNGVFGDPINNSGGRDLGDLIILEEIFGNGGGVFNGSGSDLGDLFILDELFSDAGGGVFSNGNAPASVTVQPGDTLSAISATYLGDATRYPEIAAANSIANPNVIFPGQVLTIPGQAAGTSSGRDLGDLFILDRVFDSNGGVLD